VRERRLATRLEGFGDIVFGFAVSQCALELPTAHGHVDFAHPVSLASYFGTFALLASLWLTYHRLLSGSYRPTRLDLFLALAYRALVSLMPFAMYSVTREQESLASARAAIAEYAILFASMMGSAAVLTLRNLRRGWWTIGDDERTLTWSAFLRQCVLCALMLVAFATDLTLGPAASSVAFIAIFPATSLLRMRVKAAPSAAALRVNIPKS